MTTITAIASSVAQPVIAAPLQAPPSQATPASPAPQTFGDMITHGVEQVESKIDTADALVRQFATDDSVPVHDVTVALEEARLSVELALQVRNHLVDGYREIMNMQL